MHCKEVVMKIIVSSIVILAVIIMTQYHSFASSSYSIKMPNGWNVKKKTTKSSNDCIEAIHPTGAGLISVQTFKDSAAQSKFEQGTPEDYANRVTLPIFRKSCPSAQLLTARRASLDGVDGYDSLMVCGPYYFYQMMLVRGDDVYHIATSFVDDPRIRNIIDKSLLTFKVKKINKWHQY